MKLNHVWTQEMIDDCGISDEGWAVAFSQCYLLAEFVDWEYAEMPAQSSDDADEPIVVRGS